MFGIICGRRRKTIERAEKMKTNSLAISLMRRLDAAGPQTAVQLAAALHSSAPASAMALQRLSDVFGAVAKGSDRRWRLLFSPQWLDGEWLAAQVPGAIVVDEASGTSDLAKKAKRGAVFFAEHQTAGRGRRGRKWLAMPAGSLMLSAREKTPSAPAGLSLAMGAALRRVFSGEENSQRNNNAATSPMSHAKTKAKGKKDVATSPNASASSDLQKTKTDAASPSAPWSRLQLKWPNDLLDEKGRKVGGILIETVGGDVAVGAGVNLRMTSQLQAAIGRPAAALSLGGRTRNELAAIAAETMRQTMEEFARRGIGDFLEEALAAHYIRPGEELTLALADGRRIRGSFCGFGKAGGLRVREEGGDEKEYISGEIVDVAGG